DDLADRRGPGRDPARGRLAGAVAARRRAVVHGAGAGRAEHAALPQTAGVARPRRPAHQPRHVPGGPCRTRRATQKRPAASPRKQRAAGLTKVPGGHGTTCTRAWKSISFSSLRSVMTWRVRFHSPVFSAFSFTVSTWTGRLSSVLSLTLSRPSAPLT